MPNLVKKDRGFFDEFFDGVFNSRRALMKTDIKDNGESYTFEVDLPGFDKKDIKISVEDGYLNIAACKNEKHEEKDKKGNYVTREREYGSVQRSYYVGTIKTDDLKAKYQDGTLTIDVPKEKESQEETKYLTIE